MVRMVYRNNFYEMGWGISDEKRSYGLKNVKVGNVEKKKNSFDVQKNVFEGFVKDKITLKIIAVPSATILA